MPAIPTLQVLVCTFGDRISQITAERYPRLNQVEYVVSWQASDGILPPAELLSRPDMILHREPSRGLSANRNAAFSLSSAPLLVIADDDLIYTPENLKSVINAFQANPDCGILSFRLNCPSAGKSYPSDVIDLAAPPAGFYLSSCELAFRRESITLPDGSLRRFNTFFGVGALFCANEEELFVHDALKAGAKGRFIPSVIATHPEATTSEKMLSDPEFIYAKGAAFLHLHPISWPLRMLAHALRKDARNTFGFRQYVLAWIKGVRLARRHHAFSKVRHDHSSDSFS